MPFPCRGDSESRPKCNVEVRFPDPKERARKPREKRRASSATPKSANKWLGGEEFCILHFSLERSDYLCQILGRSQAKGIS